MSEDRYRILLDRASDGIVSIDGTGKIVEFNQKAEEIFQYTKDEVIGQNLSKLIPKDNSPVHKRGISHLVETKEPRIGKTMEVVGVRKDGTLFPHEISVSTFQIDDEPIFTAIIRDISDRKKAEEKIRRQNEELILLNTIASIIGQSIELNQILSSALSFIMEASEATLGGLFLPENSQWQLAAYKDATQKFKDGNPEPDLKGIFPIVNYVADKGEIIIAHENEPKNPKLPGPLFFPHNLQSFICLPLKSKERVVGVLMMGSKTDILFSEEDHELLKSLGNTIGVAIDHARLFEEVKKTKKPFSTSARPFVFPGEEGKGRATLEDAPDRVGRRHHPDWCGGRHSSCRQVAPSARACRGAGGAAKDRRSRGGPGHRGQ